MRAVDDDCTWHVGHDILESAVDLCDPYVPLVFPVGDDDESDVDLADDPALLEAPADEDGAGASQHIDQHQ